MPDVDEGKQACILGWIGSILQREVSISDLLDGVIFLDLLHLTSDFVIDVSQFEKPIDRFCRIEEILNDFFHTSSVRFVNYEDILQPNENAHYNVLVCALLVLSLGLQTKNGVTFMKAAQKLREEFHQEVVELTKNLVRVDMTNPLSSDMFSLLKQSNSGCQERECTTPVLPTRPTYGFYETPMGSLETLLRSPQIMQKTRLREKDAEIRRLRSALDNERRLRSELEAELAESQRRVLGQETRLEEAGVRVRAAQKEGRDLRAEAENAGCYRQRAEAAEEERDRLRARLERLQSLGPRNKALEAELRELHAERVTLRQQLENLAGSEMRQHQVTLLELELSELRDGLAKAKAELVLVAQARDMSMEECARLSEAVMELRRQQSSSRSVDQQVEFVGSFLACDSAASTPSMELPPLGERMSLVHEKRVVELERALDEMRAATVRRADYERLMSDYELLQQRRQALSDELAEEKRLRSEAEQRARRRAGEWSSPPNSPRGSKMVASAGGERGEGEGRERPERPYEQAAEGGAGEEEKWKTVVAEAVSEVMDEEEAEEGVLESAEADDLDTVRSSLSVSDPGDVVRRAPNTEAHLQELRENRRSLAHEIVELNAQFEELQMHNETLQEEADFARNLAAENVLQLRSELAALRDEHAKLAGEFTGYQRQIGGELHSLAEQVRALLEENSKLKMERMERSGELHAEGELQVDNPCPRQLASAENSALIQMINNLKNQVKCLLLDPLGNGEVLSIDDEANYICNGSAGGSARIDSPFTEEDILERLGAIIDEFCASMCSLAGRMHEDQRKKKDIEELQLSLNRSMDSNARLGAALQEANANLQSKESCMAEMEVAKNCLVDEVDKLKAFMKTLEASLENSEAEYKAAFESLQTTAEHLRQVASQKQENILRLQQKVNLLSSEKHVLMERVLALEGEPPAREGSVNSSFEDTVKSAVEERNAMNAKLLNIESKLEALVGEKELSEFTNASLSENVIEMSLENENMAATIKQLEETVEQFRLKVEALTEELRKAEEERRLALERERLALGQAEKEFDASSEENAELKDAVTRLRAELAGKADLCETLAMQLCESDAARQELEGLRLEVVERRDAAGFLQKSSAQMTEALQEAEAENAALRQEKVASEREAAALREVKAALERQRANVQSARERLEEQLRAKDADLARLRDDAGEAARWREEAESQRRRADQLEEEVEALEARGKRRGAEERAERTELEKARERAARRAESAAKEAEELRRRLQEEEEEAELTRARLQSSQASEEALKTRLAAVERMKLSQCPGEEEYRAQIASSKNRITGLERRLHFLEEEVGRLEKQAMEWRARANSLEEKNRVLDEQLRRYVESYEAKKAALKEALESVDNETRLKEHFKQKNLYLEEEMLPLRRRHSELTAENRRLAQRVRSAEAQLEYAGRLMKQPGKNGANWRASLPPQALELADSFMPPFPTEPADVPSPTRQSKDDAVCEDQWLPASIPTSSTRSTLAGAVTFDPSEAGRLAELQRRNGIQPQHMKTSYPVETQACDARDVIEILGSSSTTTVTRQSLASTLPARSAPFDAAENLFSSLRQSHRSPTRSSAVTRKNRPSSTPLLARDSNRESLRCSPIPKSGGMAFEITNTPKRPSEAGRANQRRIPRTQSFHAK